jgi:Fur family ferric uptake transcriptional regulator
MTSTDPIRRGPPAEEDGPAHLDAAEARATGGSRQTRQRTAIERYLADCAGFQTAQQIHDHLRGLGEVISLATVYRTLQQLADADRVDVLPSEDHQTAYRRCSSGHHHHLICRRCGTAVEIGGEQVERWTAEVAALHGYTSPNHAIEIYGLCSSCTRERADT